MFHCEIDGTESFVVGFLLTFVVMVIMVIEQQNNHHHVYEKQC